MGKKKKELKGEIKRRKKFWRIRKENKKREEGK